MIDVRFNASTKIVIQMLKKNADDYSLVTSAKLSTE